jgi:hypothetical protein
VISPRLLPHVTSPTSSSTCPEIDSSGLMSYRLLIGHRFSLWLSSYSSDTPRGPMSAAATVSFRLSSATPITASPLGVPSSPPLPQKHLGAALRPALGPALPRHLRIGRWRVAWHQLAFCGVLVFTHRHFSRVSVINPRLPPRVMSPFTPRVMSPTSTSILRLMALVLPSHLFPIGNRFSPCGSFPARATRSLSSLFRAGGPD